MLTFKSSSRTMEPVQTSTSSRAEAGAGATSAWPAAVCAGVALVAATGCIEPTQRAVIAVPAAHEDGVDRPLQLLPPTELRDKPSDAVVRLVTHVTCTGTLIADDLVLTAHHCVSARDDKGRALEHDIEPEEVSIELGGDYLPWGEVGVRSIVTPDCGYASGNGDIAILVLTRKLIGVTTMRPRLNGEPQPYKPAANDHDLERAEEVYPIGFGRCALSQGGIHRVWRPWGTVKSLYSGQFTGMASICPGDSGAPGYSAATGEIVGVVSASVMDGDENTLGMTYFTRVDVWKQLFSAAREIADGAAPSELPPFRTCR